MGTRSLTEVLDRDGKPLVTMYKQYDGYPTGLGDELAEYLSGSSVVNGLGADNGELVFNGAGCLAASIVARFKTQAGNVYLQQPGQRDCGEEYIYTLQVDSGRVRMLVYAGCMTAFGLPGTKAHNMNCIYDGYAEGFCGKDVEEVEWNLPEPSRSPYCCTRTRMILLKNRKSKQLGTAAERKV